VRCRSGELRPNPTYGWVVGFGFAPVGVQLCNSPKEDTFFGFLMVVSYLLGNRLSTYRVVTLTALLTQLLRQQV